MEEKRKKAEYRSSIRSKQMIKEALLSLMIEKPFEKISITDIVKRADINRGTFYAHYANTSEVLKSISITAVDELAAVVKNDYDSTQVFDSPEILLSAVTKFLSSDSSFYAKLLNSDRFYDILDDVRQKAINRVITDLGDRINQETKISLIIVLDYAISGIMTLYEDILLAKIPVTLDDSVEYISRTLRPQRIALLEAFQQMQK